MDLDKAARDMREFVRLIDEANAEQVTQGHAYAEAERTYRHVKARAWATTAGKSMLAEERKDAVGDETRNERYDRDLADSLRKSALEAERSHRAKLSALQTLINAHRAEAEFARTSPREMDG
jgi:hypothetical protein